MQHREESIDTDVFLLETRAMDLRGDLDLVHNEREATRLRLEIGEVNAQLSALKSTRATLMTIASSPGPPPREIESDEEMGDVEMEELLTSSRPTTGLARSVRKARKTKSTGATGCGRRPGCIAIAVFFALLACMVLTVFIAAGVYFGGTPGSFATAWSEFTTFLDGVFPKGGT
jgi:hypothetical protein